MDIQRLAVLVHGRPLRAVKPFKIVFSLTVSRRAREAGNAGRGTGGQDDLSASVAAMPVLLVLIRRGEVKPAQEWLFERP
jgi:hypothetical protein